MFAYVRLTEKSESFCAARLSGITRFFPPGGTRRLHGRQDAHRYTSWEFSAAA
jgi:hypothetical protein